MTPNKNQTEVDDQDIDESLFPNAEDAAEANEIWAGGNEENDRAKPTGPFQARIDNATLERSSSGDRLQIHYELTILTPGKFADGELHKYDGLGTPQQAAISQNQLRRLGIDTKKVSLKTLPATLLSLKDKKCVINCRIKGDYHNIFFTKLLNEGVAGPRASTPSKASSTNTAARTTTAGAGAGRTGGRKF